MKAMSLNGPGRLVAIETAVPAKKDDEVMIKVTYGGICGTDLKIFEGGIPVQYPLVMGHEMIGRVIEDSSDGELKPGARVIVDPVWFCGACYLCEKNLTNLCPKGGLLGRDKNGGFTEYIAVSSANVYPLPESTIDQEAPLIQVLTTCLHAQRRAAVSKDESVVIMGLGVSGLLHMQLAKALGASQVICVTQNTWKRELAEALGADAIFESGVEARSGIHRLTDGRGVDLVIECSGQLPVLSEAFDLVRFGGRIMPFGIHTAIEGALPFYQFYFKEINIINTRAAKADDYPASINLIERGAIQLSPMVTHVEPLSELSNALAILKDNSIKRMKIIIDNSW